MLSMFLKSYLNRYMENIGISLIIKVDTARLYIVIKTALLNSQELYEKEGIHYSPGNYRKSKTATTTERRRIII